MKAEVKLHIRVSMPEKLIRQALDLGAEFAGIQRSGKRAIIVSCSECSSEILLALCRKYHLDCRILKNNSRGKLLLHLKSRPGLLAGFVLCLFLCSAVLSRFWIIDIQFSGPCAHLGSEKEIRRRLDAYGLYPGMQHSSVDADLLQKQLSADTGAYSHIGVHCQGIRLLIEAVPEVPAPEVYDLGNARDLVAAMDGVVSFVNVKSGQACVKAGDTVRKGQLLIRGEEYKSEEETAAVGALGEVYIRSWFEGSAEGDLKEKRLRRTGRASLSSAIRLWKYSLPLNEGADFKLCETESSILPIIGLFLPLELVQKTNFEAEEVLADIDQAVLENHLRILAQAQARSSLSKSGPTSYEITDYWEESTMENNTLRMRTVYEITADIAVTRDALIEEVN